MVVVKFVIAKCLNQCEAAPKPLFPYDYILIIGRLLGVPPPIDLSCNMMELSLQEFTNISGGGRQPFKKIVKLLVCSFFYF